MSNEENCLFCSIARGDDKDTIILHETDDLVIIRDIHPVATHHYLVVPKIHIKHSKALKSDDADLVKRMTALAKAFLVKQGRNPDDIRLGFHWPPFYSVAHLHLHVIHPVSEMSWVARIVFKHGSWWFRQPEYVLQQIKDST